MIATPGGVRDSDISQQGYEKPTMINQCSNYATADDYWIARTDNHKIMMLLPRCRCGMIKETLFLIVKILGNFILQR